MQHLWGLKGGKEGRFGGSIYLIFLSCECERGVGKESCGQNPLSIKKQCNALEDRSTHAGGERFVWALQLKDEAPVTDAVPDGRGGAVPP